MDEQVSGPHIVKDRIMTRHWTAAVSRTLGMIRSGPARRRRTSPCIENREHRLSMSSYSAGGLVVADLDPQPLPPRAPVDH